MSKLSDRSRTLCTIRTAAAGVCALILAVSMAACGSTIATTSSSSSPSSTSSQSSSSDNSESSSSDEVPAQSAEIAVGKTITDPDTGTTITIESYVAHYHPSGVSGLNPNANNMLVKYTITLGNATGTVSYRLEPNNQLSLVDKEGNKYTTGVYGLNSSSDEAKVMKADGFTPLNDVIKSADTVTGWVAYSAFKHHDVSDLSVQYTRGAMTLKDVTTGELSAVEKYQTSVTLAAE